MNRCLFLILTAFWLTGCIHRCEGPCVNGYCHEEACVCYNGYSGNTCDTQIEPSSIRIWEVKVANFPASNEGVAWDPDGSGPDIFPSLFFPGENEPFYLGSSRKESDPMRRPKTTTLGRCMDGRVRSPSCPKTSAACCMTWSSNRGIPCASWGRPPGPLYGSDNGFPATITITEGDYSFELSVNYEW